MKRRWWLAALLSALTVGSILALTRDQGEVYTAEAVLLFSESAPLLGRVSRPNRSLTHLEQARTLTVLRPVSAAVGFGVQLDGRPQHRTALLRDLIVEDPPGGRFILTLEDERVVLGTAAGDSVLGSYDLDERVVGPGFSFGPVDSALLVEPATLQVLGVQEAAQLLRTLLVVEEGKESGLLRLLFSHGDPAFAASVVNLAAESYVDFSRTSNKDTHGRRRDAIAEQTRVLSDSLRAAQEAWAEYQRGVQLLDPGMQADALVRSTLRTEEDLYELRFRRRILESVVAGFQDTRAPADTVHTLMIRGGQLIPGAQALYAEFRDLEARRVTLAADRIGGLTETNPAVVQVDAQIEVLRAAMAIQAREALSLERARVGSGESEMQRMRAELGTVRSRAPEYQRLQRWMAAVEANIDLLLGEYFEAQVEEGSEAGDVSVLDFADVPELPDPSLRGILVALGLLGALTAAAFGAVGLDRLDTTVRRPADVERLVEVPVVGTIPTIKGNDRGPKSFLISKESFRGLRTNIRFALGERPQSLLVTSAEPSDGKSTVVTNIALTIAEQGERVLLVDADLRRPQVHRIVGVDRTPGLADVLMGSVSVSEATVPSTVHRGLWVLPAGIATSNPAELIGGDRLEGLLEWLRVEYDTVLIDTVPVLAATDASLIAPAVDATLVVTRANRSDERALARAVRQLRAVKARLAGVIVNDVPLAKVQYSSYYDSYYDGAEVDRSPRPVL